MASRFSPTMSGQMPGCPAAIRVMSRKPPAARRSRARCSSARSSARRMRVAAARCGTWDTSATRASWRSGARATTSAPMVTMAERTVAKVSSTVAVVGVSTQVAPSKRSALAAAMPSCSEPAIGWPPRKPGWSTAATTDALTLPTSVTTRWPASSRRRASPATAPTGVATIVRSEVGSSPTASRAPRSTATSAFAGSRSVPTTTQPARRRASPIEPPISPVPTSVAFCAVTESPLVSASPTGRWPRCASPAHLGRSSRRLAAPCW